MSDIKALVLCAGKGTRLHTEGIDLPKVMRLANGQPLLHYVLDALSFLPKEDIVLIVGYQKEAVLAAYGDYPSALQAEQKGTGHAVRCGMEALDPAFDGHILVASGDMPLMRRATYEAMVKTHLDGGNLCTVLSGRSDEALPYGRVIRDEAGSFLKIVEEKDTTDEEKAVTELNAGVYLFAARELAEALKHLKSDNAQGEYYLTDVPEYLRAHGGKVAVCDVCTPTEMLGVNTPAQLQEVEDILAQAR